MQVLEYLKLVTKKPEQLDAAQRARAAELDRADERIGNQLATWGIPAVLLLGMTLLLVLGWLWN